MSSTLVTIAAGSSAAGSQGVSEGSRGDPRAGEPDPVPLPANPSPETLQYVTVYDNRDKGGFAGASRSASRSSSAARSTRSRARRPKRSASAGQPRRRRCTLVR